MKKKYIKIIIVMLLIIIAGIFSILFKYSETVTIINIEEIKFLAEENEENESYTKLLIRYYDWEERNIIDQKLLDTYKGEISISGDDVNVTYYYNVNNRISITFVDSNQQNQIKYYTSINGYRYTSMEVEDGGRIIYLNFVEVQDTLVNIRFYDHTGQYMLFDELIGYVKIEDKESYISRKRWQSELGIRDSIEVTSGKYYYQSAKMENNILYLDYKIQIGYFKIEIYKMEQYEKVKEDEEYGTEYRMLIGQNEVLPDNFNIYLINKLSYERTIANNAKNYLPTGYKYLGYYIEYEDYI